MNQPIFYDIQQGTDEWLSLRRGKFTASRCNDLLMAKTTAGYKNLIYQIAYERKTDESPESFKSEWMQRGNDLEPFALENYSLENFCKVYNGGYYELNDWVGCSPDAHLSGARLLQAKCPAWNTHIKMLDEKKVASNYYNQVQFEMMCSEKEECILYYFHPKLKSISFKIKRDDELIKKIEQEIETAKKEVERIMNLL